MPFPWVSKQRPALQFSLLNTATRLASYISLHYTHPGLHSNSSSTGDTPPTASTNLSLSTLLEKYPTNISACLICGLSHSQSYTPAYTRLRLLICLTLLQRSKPNVCCNSLLLLLLPCAQHFSLLSLACKLLYYLFHIDFPIFLLSSTFKVSLSPALLVKDEELFSLAFTPPSTNFTPFFLYTHSHLVFSPPFNIPHCQLFIAFQLPFSLFDAWCLVRLYVITYSIF